jgi:hypothetical protein
MWGAPVIWTEIKDHFTWRRNWNLCRPIYFGRPPLCCSGKSFWLQIHRPEFDSRRYHIFWEVVGLERGPLSLVITIEELLEIKSSCSGLEIREYGRKDPSGWTRGTLYPQKLTLTSPTSGGRSVGKVVFMYILENFTKPDVKHFCVRFFDLNSSCFS